LFIRIIGKIKHDNSSILDANIPSSKYLKSKKKQKNNKGKFSEFELSLSAKRNDIKTNKDVILNKETRPPIINEIIIKKGNK